MGLGMGGSVAWEDRAGREERGNGRKRERVKEKNKRKKMKEFNSSSDFCIIKKTNTCK